MTEFNNSHTSLDDVHVGDHVAITRNNEKYWTLAKVTEDTKTTVTVNGKKFMRSTGRERGANTSGYYSNYWIIVALGREAGAWNSGITYADRVRLDAPLKATEDRYNAAYGIVRNVEWHKMPVHVLEAVAAIVEAEQKAKEETK